MHKSSPLFQYFALYTQLENMPEEDADDELDIDDGGNSFGVKISSKSGAKMSFGKSAAAAKAKRKG